MKNVKVEQFRIVHHTSADIYTEELNKAMRELRELNPVVEFHAHDPTYAIIRYTVTEQIPETIADEFSLKGIRFTCFGDCRLLEGRDDRRKRRFSCPYNDYIDYREQACEEFYKRAARGDREWRIME